MTKSILAFGLVILGSVAQASFSASDFIFENRIVEIVDEVPLGDASGNAFINPKTHPVYGPGNDVRLASIWFPAVGKQRFAVGELNYGGLLVPFKAQLGDIISSGKYAGFRAGSGQVVARYGQKKCLSQVIVIVNRTQFDVNGTFSVQVIATNRLNQVSIGDSCSERTENIFAKPGNPAFERFDADQRAQREYEL